MSHIYFTLLIKATILIIIFPVNDHVVQNISATYSLLTHHISALSYPQGKQMYSIMRHQNKYMKPIQYYHCHQYHNLTEY